MGVFGTVKKFAGGLNWVRIFLIIGIASSIFGLGYLYAGQHYAQKEADWERDKAAAIKAEGDRVAKEWKIKIKVSQDAETQLRTDIAEITTHRDTLIEAIRSTQLTKPIPEIRVEACLESDDENVQIVVANPFNADFVRLWNEGSRGVARSGGSEGTDPE